MNETVNQILDYWFGEIEEGFCTEDRGKLWFAGGEEVDATIREQFGKEVELACNNELDAWQETPRGRMALILLLDQFTRNIYRGTSEAFAHDAQAQAICKAGLDLGHDQELPYVMRSFFYLPLEHAEDPDSQERCVALYRALHAEVPEPYKEKTKSNLEYALLHRDIIVQFGRFPHRNQALGRTSTPEEEAYLAGNHHSFGQ